MEGGPGGAMFATKLKLGQIKSPNLLFVVRTIEVLCEARHA